MIGQTIHHVVIRGRVQGVGYRAWIEQKAIIRGLEGWVRNRRDGTVEAVFVGPEQHVTEIIEACREGPRGAIVTAVDIEDSEDQMLTSLSVTGPFTVLPTA